MTQNNSANYNEAIMELGALICSPKNPNCINCPVNKYCEAYKDDLTNVIPFKSKSAAKPLAKIIVQIVKRKSQFLIARRKEYGLLGGYWEFPFKNIENEIELKKYSNIITVNGIKHSYTHFNFLMYPALINEDEIEISKKLYIENKWVKLKDINKYPIHKAMQKVLNILEKN